ncbi:MAG: hypothetical protein ACNI3C_10425 [Candidatus Marinarcus sp.]|uniref:hypothetical protein n=1 Tax=Candidatus Marinarcus sp. TaxID=3100987 RepID=UPI003B000685
MEKFKNIIEILSKVSTIGIFILALFGYIYTVKPKFLLDNMKLEMADIEKDVNFLKKEKVFLEDKILGLEKEKIKLNKNFEEIKSKKDLEIKGLLESFNFQKNNYEKQVLLFNNKIEKQKKILNNFTEENSFLRKKMDETRWFLFINFLSNIKLKEPYVSKEDNYFYLSEHFYHNNAIIELNNKDKFLLNKSAPYEILKDSFLSIEYSNDMIFRESEFYNFKNKILKLLEKNKSEFSYNGIELFEKTKNLNALIKLKLEKIQSLDKEHNEYELKKLENDIYNLHEKFRDFKVEKINQLNMDINKVFKKMTNINLKSSGYTLMRF